MALSASFMHASSMGSEPLARDTLRSTCAGKAAATHVSSQIGSFFALVLGWCIVCSTPCTPRPSCSNHRGANSADTSECLASPAILPKYASRAAAVTDANLRTTRNGPPRYLRATHAQRCEHHVSHTHNPAG